MGPQHRKHPRNGSDWSLAHHLPWHSLNPLNLYHSKRKKVWVRDAGRQLGQEPLWKTVASNPFYFIRFYSTLICSILFYSNPWCSYLFIIWCNLLYCFLTSFHRYLSHWTHSRLCAKRSMKWKTKRNTSFIRKMCRHFPRKVSDQSFMIIRRSIIWYLINMINVEQSKILRNN